jgi:hypothetical protein
VVDVQHIQSMYSECGLGTNPASVGPVLIVVTMIAMS